MITTGEIIGNRYELILPLGEQKRKEIWVAENLNNQSSVALVVFEPGENDAHRVDSFCSEMSALIDFEHPNVVSIEDVGKTRLGVGFAAMELLEGDTLADRLAEEPTLWLSEFMNIATEFLEGLAVLHDVGFVHGDIEPSNIFFVSDYGRLMPKLSGLGYSRAEARSDSTLADPDDDGYIRTLAYASPEQVRGDGNIDVRTDIYSLGVVLFEAFSGCCPHYGATIAEVRKSIFTNASPALTSVRKDIPVMLSDTVKKMMSVNPADRYENARAVQRDLLSMALALPESFKNAPLPVLSRNLNTCR